MDPRTELQELLNGGLPLDSVSPRLRDAARLAVRSGDIPHMRMVARTIIAELQRQGNDLRHGTPSDPSSAATSPPANGNDNLGFDQLLVAMEIAQDLRVGGPEASEIGTVLTSTIAILEQLAPPFRLAIMLFESTELGETNGRVFCLDSIIGRPAWLELRPVGQSVFIPSADELPGNIASGPAGVVEQSVAVAVPLCGPSAGDREAGLLFVLAPADWPPEALLRVGAKLSRFATRRWQVHHELNQKIHIDALTGLYNRRFLDGQLPLLVERARRSQTSLTMIVSDIDFFKSVNTEYGLMVGDQVLQTVARRLQEEVRRVDLVCRRGGEEFAIIMPETDFEAAQEVVTRLLNAPFVTVTQHLEQTVEVHTTLSHGVSIFPVNAENDDQLHSQAASMMFMSKDLGRNRCHFWGDDGEALEMVGG